MKYFHSLFNYLFCLPEGHFKFYTLITLTSAWVIPLVVNLNYRRTIEKAKKVKKAKKAKKIEAKAQKKIKEKEDLKKYGRGRV